MTKSKKISVMYFEVKAFRKGERRFENLDNINELNEFVAERVQMGFNKFIVKSFDCNGFRKRRFCIADEYGFTRLLKDKI